MRSMRSAGRDGYASFPSRGKTRSDHTPHTHLHHHALHCTLCVSCHVCVFLCCLWHCGLVSACERVTQLTVCNTVPQVHAHMHNTMPHKPLFHSLPPSTEWLQVAAIETVMSEIDIFASPTDNFNIVTLDHLLKNKTTAGNTGLFAAK